MLKNCCDIKVLSIKLEEPLNKAQNILKIKDMKNKIIIISDLISSEFDSASPFMVESKEETKSLKEVIVEPNSTSGWDTFSNTDKMAWVAQALLITWTNMKVVKFLKTYFYNLKILDNLSKCKSMLQTINSIWDIIHSREFKNIQQMEG